MLKNGINRRTVTVSCNDVPVHADVQSHTHWLIMNNKSVPEVLEKIKLEIRKYSDRELKVVGVHMDNAFNTETFKKSLDGAIFVPYATNEHVAIAEREIRTLK